MGPDNIALRGTKLQNTEYVFGCAVYTGSDTKMSQNSQLKANKFSSIEVAMNKYLVVYILILLFEIMLSMVLKYTASVDSQFKGKPVPNYIPATNNSMSNNNGNQSPKGTSSSSPDLHHPVSLHQREGKTFSGVSSKSAKEHALMMNLPLLQACSQVSYLSSCFTTTSSPSPCMSLWKSRNSLEVCSLNGIWSCTILLLISQQSATHQILMKNLVRYEETILFSHLYRTQSFKT